MLLKELDSDSSTEPQQARLDMRKTENGHMRVPLYCSKLTLIEDIIDGLENAPETLIRLLKGDNRGKRMIRVRA